MNTREQRIQGVFDQLKQLLSEGGDLSIAARLAREKAEQSKLLEEAKAALARSETVIRERETEVAALNHELLFMSESFDRTERDKLLTECDGLRMQLEESQNQADSLAKRLFNSQAESLVYHQRSERAIRAYRASFNREATEVEEHHRTRDELAACQALLEKEISEVNSMRLWGLWAKELLDARNRLARDDERMFSGKYRDPEESDQRVFGVGDFLDNLVADRTKDNPGFPALLQRALDRKANGKKMDTTGS